MAKDKTTGQSKVGVVAMVREGLSVWLCPECPLPPLSQGCAFISFHRREDAARAIAGVSGFGYDHLILNVEWAK